MAIALRPAEDILSEVLALGDPDLCHKLAATFTERRVERGETAFTETDAGQGLLLVRGGELKVTRKARDGREQILYLVRAGRPIVEGIRFDGGVYGANGTVMRTATLTLISNETIALVGRSHPILLQRMVDLRAHRVDRHLALIGDLALRTVPARLASFVCTLVETRRARGEDVTTLVRDLTTETVAARLGTVREEISRALTTLEKGGALRVSPDVIEIADLEKLQNIAYGSRGH